MTRVTLLRGGQVADGTGAPLLNADVLLADGKIAGIGNFLESDADVVVDCAGLIVAPGFIDIHTHSDLTRFAYPECESRVLQGITTEVIGNCGLSPAPIRGNPDDVRAIIGPVDIVADVEVSWNSVSEYFAALDATPAATNVAPLVGHGTIVLAAQTRVGVDPHHDDDRRATMVAELQEALAAGAWGLSLGLMYSPGELSPVDELTELARSVAQHDALLSMHMRAYDGDGLADAVTEALQIAETAGARLQISHFRSIRDDDGSALDAAIALVENANGDVQADAYPYLAGHTTMLQLLPTALRALPVAEIAQRIADAPAAVAEMLESAAGFPPEAITVAKASANPLAVSKTLAELVAESAHESWGSLAVGLLSANDLNVDVIIVGTRPVDALRVLQHPLVSVASDGLALSLTHDANLPHPRSIGTFPRSFDELSRAGMTTEEIVHKMTAKPAARLGFTDRGVLAVGACADVTVFDASTVADRATYASPLETPQGIAHVFVNGVRVVRDGRHTHELPGHVLRRRTA
ncbi:amidohydrolase family protein [Salinibacterium sp. SWN248]|uniref:N-acyl-D-amino-acid deacylase family protein n=1 Tax=Salinibacterium sp. SWN248 TaxID=2792056 RepID=UPI0018CF46CE|nr:amidohydrolase family protein [Salinibacterium sp. SWN248]MBH0024330.1 amidohydrolase family protein [Salinibacterium sp. SWN248]